MNQEYKSPAKKVEIDVSDLRDYSRRIALNSLKRGLIVGFVSGILVCISAYNIFVGTIAKQARTKFAIPLTRVVEEGFATPSKLEISVMDTNENGIEETLVHYDKRLQYYLRFDGNDLFLKHYNPR